MTDKIENLLTEADKLFWLRQEISCFSNKRTRKARSGSREKKAFYVNWLTQRIYFKSYRGPKITEHKSWERCFKEAEEYLQEDGEHTLSCFLKQKKKYSGLFSMPEIYMQSVQADKIDQQVSRLLNLPIQYTASTKSIEEIATLKRENRLIKRVVKQLCRSSALSQRELCRRLGTTLSFLRPVLEILEWAHFVVWDRAKKRISTDQWNPQDNRLFRWLAESSFPWLGPKLVKGKIHKCCEYNSRAVEGWIRTGAAELCENLSLKEL